MHSPSSSAFCTTQAPTLPAMSDLADRLRRARVAAGFDQMVDAARRLGVNPNTYAQLENGLRGFRQPTAEQYARAIAVDLTWLLTGKGEMGRKAKTGAQNTVPVVGYVSAGAEAVLFGEGQGPFDDVPAPAFASPETVAVEIRGESLGPFFNEWLVFYDDVRSPITPDLIGELCVVGLPDKRVLIKKIQNSRTEGLYHLLSQNEPPILDVPVDWAARVTGMQPR